MSFANDKKDLLKGIINAKDLDGMNDIIIRYAQIHNLSIDKSKIPTIFHGQWIEKFAKYGVIKIDGTGARVDVNGNIPDQSGKFLQDYNIGYQNEIIKRWPIILKKLKDAGIKQEVISVYLVMTGDRGKHSWDNNGIPKRLPNKKFNNIIGALAFEYKTKQSIKLTTNPAFAYEADSIGDFAARASEFWMCNMLTDPKTMLAACNAFEYSY